MQELFSAVAAGVPFAVVSGAAIALSRRRRRQASAQADTTRVERRSSADSRWGDPPTMLR
jgi:hypothetical protein